MTCGGQLSSRRMFTKEVRAVSICGPVCGADPLLFSCEMDPPRSCDVLARLLVKEKLAILFLMTEVRL